MVWLAGPHYHLSIPLWSPLSALLFFLSTQRLLSRPSCPTVGQNLLPAGAVVVVSCSFSPPAPAAGTGALLSNAASNLRCSRSSSSAVCFLAAAASRSSHSRRLCAWRSSSLATCAAVGGRPGVEATVTPGAPSGVVSPDDEEAPESRGFAQLALSVP